MKKIAASVGLLALGASALHAAETSTLNDMQQTKAWSISATLRGFYDDNITSVPDVPGVSSPTESAGVEISPSVDYGFAGDQTSFNVGYTFTARYFDKNPGRADKSDYTHVFDADLSHAFNPRLSLSADESFVIGQEPDLLRDPASTQRIDGDNIRNFAGINLDLELTRLVGLSVGYNNSIYDYDDETAGLTGTIVTGPSNSGLYDRMEHSLRLDTRWKLSPQTTGIIGYTYGQNGFTGDEAIAGDTTVAPGLPGGVVMSDFRDSRSHTVYGGAQHVFNANFSGTITVGAQRTEYINDPAGESEWNPYVQGSVNYLYQTTTSFDAGVRYSRTAANEAGGGGTAFVRDTATAVVYGSVRQELASKLFLTANATLQHSTYNAPNSVVFDDQSFLFYQLGLDLSYEFNQNLSGHIGYNHDQMKSDLINRDYERNRVYMGVTAGF